MDQQRTESLYCGHLDIIKTKGSKTRYFVLFRDRLEYFASADVCGYGAAPHGNVVLEDVKTVETSSFGLNDILITLDDRRIQLRAHDLEEAMQWGCVLKEALANYGGMLSGVSVNALSDDSTACSASCGEEGHSGTSTPERTPRENVDDHAVSHCDEGVVGSVVCAGPLAVGWRHKQKRREQRYVVVFDDRLEYYDDVASWEGSANPRACIMRADFQRVEVSDSVISVGILSRTLELECDGSRTPTWIAALKGLAKVSDLATSAPHDDSSPQPCSSNVDVRKWCQTNKLVSDKQDYMQKCQCARDVGIEGPLVITPRQQPARRSTPISEFNSDSSRPSSQSGRMSRMSHAARPSISPSRQRVSLHRRANAARKIEYARACVSDTLPSARSVPGIQARHATKVRRSVSFDQYCTLIEPEFQRSFADTRIAAVEACMPEVAEINAPLYAANSDNDDEFDNFPIVDKPMPSPGATTNARRWRFGDRLSQMG